MPGPLSSMSTLTLFALIFIITPIVPPSGVNLTALPSRLSRATRSWVRSPLTVTGSSCRLSWMARASRALRWSPATSSMSSSRRISCRSGGASRAWAMLKSRMFWMSLCSLRQLLSRMPTTSAWLRLSGPTRPSLSRPAPSLIEASGVFSSWEMCASMRTFSRSRVRSRWRSHSSRPPMVSRSRVPPTTTGVTKSPSPSRSMARSSWRTGLRIRPMNTTTSSTLKVISPDTCQTRASLLSCTAASRAATSRPMRSLPSRSRRVTSSLMPLYRPSTRTCSLSRVSGSPSGRLSTATRWFSLARSSSTRPTKSSCPPCGASDCRAVAISAVRVFTSARWTGSPSTP